VGQFVTSVKLKFVDGFSMGAKGAKYSLAGMNSALKEIKNNDNGMTQLSAHLAMATQMTEPLRAGLDAALDVPSQKAAGLESAMAAVNSVLNEQNAIGGDVAQTYKAIEKASLQWSAGVVPGSKAATAESKKFGQATYGMISAGLEAADAINATGQALILAKATMGDAGDAGNLLGVMYNNLGGDLTDLSDIVAATQGAFQIANLGQLNEGLKYGIPAAKQYRIETAQLATSVGALNSAGLQGSMAGTAFVSMMNNLSKASSSLNFDISYNDQGGVDVIKTLENIQGKMGPLDQLSQQSSDALTAAFGSEGVRAVTLLGSDLEKLKSQYEGVANSQGMALSMAERQADTFEDSMARMNNAASVWQIKMGQGSNFVKRTMADMASGVMSWATPLLDNPVGSVFAQAAGGLGVFAQAGIGALSTGLQLTSQFALLSSAASTAGGYAKLFGSATSLLSTPFIKGGSAIKNGALAIFGWGKSAIMAVPKLYAMAAANWAALGPILGIVVGIGAAIAIGVLLYKNWDIISEKAGALWGNVTGFFSRGVSWIKGIVHEGVTFVVGLLDNKLVQGALIVVAPFIGIPLAIAKNWEVLGAFFTNLWAGIKATFTGGVNWVKEKASKVPLLGKLFEGDDSGSAAVYTVAAGMDTALPAIENSAYNVASAADAYFPHSDAKKGPLSRLTASGASLVKTFSTGAEGQGSTLDLSSILIPPEGSFKGALNDLFKGRNRDQSGGAVVIHIDKLLVQSEDIQSAVDFYELIKQAGGF